MATLLDLLETSAARYDSRNALSLRRDDGTTLHWTYAELLHRSRLAAWRLRGLGLNPGDRVVTWSASTPALPAAYYGAMYARLIFVPLDARMAPDTIARIVERSGASRLILGTGRDAPDPGEVGLESFPTTLLEDLSADPDARFPADWEAQLVA
ncbi:MAG TPA: class I adenylate-forming enzyme family protein, partial [Candidatus Limnocylindrales bacterium]